jgi:ADP-dependent phosphofructokinase/glucokinase
MSDLSKDQIQELIATYGYSHILKQFNLTPWKVLEILDSLGYIYLEQFNEP